MGIETPNGFGYVHPTFLYESIADFCIFLLLIKLSKNRNYSGQITIWYLILYSFIRFWIEGLRTDSLMLGVFRISQMVSVVLFVIAIIFQKRLKSEQK